MLGKETNSFTVYKTKTTEHTLRIPFNLFKPTEWIFIQPLRQSTASVGYLTEWHHLHGVKSFCFPTLASNRNRPIYQVMNTILGLLVQSNVLHLFKRIYSSSKFLKVLNIKPAAFSRLPPQKMASPKRLQTDVQYYCNFLC